jgi:hypothetical protein
LQAISTIEQRGTAIVSHIVHNCVCGRRVAALRRSSDDDLIERDTLPLCGFDPSLAIGPVTHRVMRFTQSRQVVT